MTKWPYFLDTHPQGCMCPACNAMREPGLEPGSLATPDPKSTPPVQLTSPTERQLPGESGETAATQSGWAPRGTGSTTGNTTPVTDRRIKDIMRVALYVSEPIRVLALWQPWAILTVAPDPAHDGEPAKAHETRHWAPKNMALPIHVAIHAAKRWDTEVKYHVGLPRFRDALERAGYWSGDPRVVPPGSMVVFDDAEQKPGPALRSLPLGAIVGLATVDFIHWTGDRELQARLTEDDKVFGNWERGRHAWRLTNTVLLPTPVPHTGRQEVLYELDDASRAAIFDQFLTPNEAGRWGRSA